MLGLGLVPLLVLVLVLVGVPGFRAFSLRASIRAWCLLASHDAILPLFSFLATPRCSPPHLGATSAC